MCQLRNIYAACDCRIGHEFVKPCKLYLEQTKHWAQLMPSFFESFPNLGCEDWVADRKTGRICCRCKAEQLRLGKALWDIKDGEKMGSFGFDIGC
jgi:hypothetical protein